ncbi:MAG: hypothetical protein MJ252_12010 [archaeon]|nr:hypothetical protein [archaeon]
MFKIQEDSQNSVLIIKSKLEMLSTTEKRAQIFLFPILVGFYVLNYEHCPKISETLMEYLTKYIVNSDQFLHIFILNVLSCKHVYKKKIGMGKLKEIICQLYNKKEENILTEGKEEDPTNIKRTNSTDTDEDNEDEFIYTSMFNIYTSFEDFVGKSLVKLTDLKQYLTDNRKLNWNMFFKIKKQNEKLLEDEKNKKWLRTISQINFINDLITISSFLTLFPIEERSKNFRDIVDYLNKECLPSPLYDPLSVKDLYFSTKNDKLLSIDSEFSFSINTKERVPCLMVFEYEVNEKEEEKESDKESINLANDSERESKGSTGKKKYSSFKDINFKLDIDKIETEGISPPKSTKTRTEISHSEIETESSSKEEKSNEDGMFGKLSFKQVKNKLIKKENLRREKLKLPPLNNFGENSSKSSMDIVSAIVKGNDEVRTDYFVDQIITLFNFFFKSIPDTELYISNCRIISNGSGGIIETIVDTVSLTKINKMIFPENFRGFQSANQSSFSLFNSYSYMEEQCSNLKKYFFTKFGYYTSKYDDAIQNFIASLAGYSLLCYFLEIRDRNNGNILVDSKGHLIHIDFGFILNRSPGNLEFENAPFKLLTDFVELLQGESSALFSQFQDTFFNGFKCIRQNSDIFIPFVEIYCYLFHDLEAFKGRNRVIQKLKDKFFFDISDESLLKEKTNELIKSCIGNWRTNAYDRFQKYCVGV